MATPQFKVVIIGAGASGMYMAIQLKQKLGIYNFVIYERDNGFGGTWAVNRYPNIACDVPSHVYSLSSDLNPNWTQQYACGEEIHKYFEGVAFKYGLPAYTKLRHEVVALTWQDDAQHWVVRTRALDTGDEFAVTANYVCSAVGGLSRPKIPTEIPGLESFKGRAFHTQQWDSTCDLRNKRVALIGNAASGIQIIPAIAPDAARVDVYQRTPNWITPRNQYHYWGITKFLFRNVPFLINFYRYFLFLLNDVQFVAFLKDSPINKVLQWDCKRYINSVIKDPVLRQKVTPNYDVGCKRILRSDDYLQSLTRPNVEVITDAIERVTPEGVVTKDGRERKVDVLIYATGFLVAEFLHPLKITGRHGKDLHADTWKELGPQAYQGTCVPGFPNMFCILGPNTGLGHNSQLAMSEGVVNYVVNIIGAMEEQGAPTIEVKQDAFIQFNKEIQQGLKSTVWTSSCKSWYKLDNGLVLALYPGSVSRFWWELMDPKWDDFDFRRTKPLPPTTARRMLRRMLAVLLVLATIRTIGTSAVRSLVGAVQSFLQSAH